MTNIVIAVIGALIATIITAVFTYIVVTTVTQPNILIYDYPYTIFTGQHLQSMVIQINNPSKYVANYVSFYVVAKPGVFILPQNFSQLDNETVGCKGGIVAVPGNWALHIGITYLPPNQECSFRILVNPGNFNLSHGYYLTNVVNITTDARYLIIYKYPFS